MINDIIPLCNIPSHLEEKRVLDIGALDGGLSFELEKRGAAEVVAIDLWQETGREGFDLACETLKSKVKGIQMDVMDVSPDNLGTFDLVFMFGVLYHLRHPLLALEKVRSVCRDLLILETHIDLLDCSKPAAAFYAGDELCHDPTNWWGPNIPCVKAWLASAGFSSAEVVANWSGGESHRACFHASV